MKKKWSRDYDKCVVCGLKKKPYHARGMCLPCYYRDRWSKNEHLRKIHKEWIYRWKAEHPERWLEIVHKAVKKYQKNNKKKLRLYNKDRYHANKNKTKRVTNS